MKSNLIYLKKLELYKDLDNYREGQFFAIADSKVKNHLPQWIQFSPNVLWLKNPEEQKNLSDYTDAVEFFLKNGIHRNATLYAFGGGATTDFTGFVAATILRGIAWCAIPTTLLGMVDAAIGGKTGLNMPQGKNLVGAFHAPLSVYICGDFLTTLSEKEWLSGKGEVLKYAFLSQEIHDMILKNESIEDIAIACARFKEGVVERDFLDQNERLFLNLGHTLGHAFESTLKIPHGQAVAMGMKYIFKIMGFPQFVTTWEKLVKALQLPIEKYSIDHYSNFDLKTFLDYLEQDKKKVDAEIRLVLVKNIGSCYLEGVPLKDFKAKIQSNAEFTSQERLT